MKKKLLIGLASLALLALLAVGAWAWFTASESVTNTFQAGTVDIELHEVFAGANNDNVFENWNPGQCVEKQIWVEATGSKCTRVRVQLDATWYNEDGETAAVYPEGHDSAGQPLSTDNVTYKVLISENPDTYAAGVGAGWYLYDGWYYYDGELKIGGTAETTVLINKVCLAGKDTGNEYQGKILKLVVNAEAIQCSNGAPLDEWGVDFDDPPWAEENGNGGE